MDLSVSHRSFSACCGGLTGEGGHWKVVWISRHHTSHFRQAGVGGHAKGDVRGLSGSPDVRNQTEHFRHAVVCEHAKEGIGRLFGSLGVRNQTEHLRHAVVGGQAKEGIEGCLDIYQYAQSDRPFSACCGGWTRKVRRWEFLGHVSLRVGNRAELFRLRSLVVCSVNAPIRLSRHRVISI